MRGRRGPLDAARELELAQVATMCGNIDLADLEVNSTHLPATLLVLMRAVMLVSCSEKTHTIVFVVFSDSDVDSEFLFR